MSETTDPQAVERSDALKSEKKAPPDAYKRLMDGAAACRRVRKDRLTRWQDNVAFRKGQPFAKVPEDETVSIPADWSRSQNKISQLFFQVPTVSLKARRPEFAKTSSLAAAALNFQLQHECRTHAVMDECLGDAVNAAGIAFAIVEYHATFEDVMMDEVDTSTMDPEMVAFARQQGMIKQVKTSRPVFEWFEINRISPARALWPIEFRGSDWSKAPWLGNEGYLPLAEAIRREWVPPDFEGDVLTVDELLDEEDAETHQTLAPGLYVKYTQIFYKASFLDPKQKHPHCIRRMVMIEGLPEGENPVVDEEFKWQKWVAPQTIPVPAPPPVPGQPPMPPPPPQVIRGHYAGMKALPIKVLTLTSISDCALPPSNTEIGRPQVKEMIRSRSQMIKQREHSLPVRWFDVNQVDEDIAQLLRAGVMQDMIPMNGPGDHAIGEVARASYPRESYDFMKVFNSDLDEAWSMGPNQQGMELPGETTAEEARNIQAANNVRLDYERSRVLRFFVEIAEGVFALMQMFSDHEDYVEVWGEDFTRNLEAWNKDQIQGDYLFEVRPDAAVRVDIGQRRSEILNVYKLIRRDPLINPQAPIRELLELFNFDLSRWIAAPKPPQPKPPNVRYSFKGEDMLSPIPVALMQKSDSPLTPEDIQNAIQMILTAIKANPQIGAAVPSENAGGEPPAPNADTEHPGPAPVVQPLNRRYERAETGIQGSE